MEAGERITGNYESRERETIKRGVVEKLLVFSTLIGKWLQGRGKKRCGKNSLERSVTYCMLICTSRGHLKNPISYNKKI